MIDKEFMTHLEYETNISTILNKVQIRKTLILKIDCRVQHLCIGGRLGDIIKCSMVAGGGRGGRDSPIILVVFFFSLNTPI